MIDRLLKPVTDVAGKYIENKDNLAELETEMATTLSKHANDINLENAKHRNLFVSGWRPAIGWVCVFGWVWNLLIAMFLGLFIKDVPVADWGTLMTLTTAMLGMSGLRTFEKVKGVTK